MEDHSCRRGDPAVVTALTGVHLSQAAWLDRASASVAVLQLWGEVGRAGTVFILVLLLRLGAVGRWLEVTQRIRGSLSFELVLLTPKSDFFPLSTASGPYPPEKPDTHLPFISFTNCFVHLGVFL